ncbi:hypothetical protein [Hanamia caeni]|jgi:hypothetical protein|uniref:hypothetical protein n=1 Tax=Hanamia caeni TaxID=2294116 RepID=UPI001313FFAB|nr:hypothetical protein [Hanamia caeni]
MGQTPLIGGMISGFDINTFVNINDDGIDAGVNDQLGDFIQQVVISFVNAQMSSNKIYK